MSQRNDERLQYEAIVEKHVGSLLTHDYNLSLLWNEIPSLCKAIFLKLEQDQFMKYFRRLLERFDLDLLNHANTDLERAASHALRSQLIRHIKDIRFNVEPSFSNVFALCLRGELVETPKPLSDPYQGGAPNSDEDKDDEDDHDDDNELDDWNARALPDFTEMRQLIIRSNALRNFVTACRIFLLPPNLRSLSRVIMTIPDKRLWFSKKEDLSIVNRFKAFAEQISDEKWCWWPFGPRMRSLLKDETRLHWRCVSDMNSRLLITDDTDKAMLALR